MPTQPLSVFLVKDGLRAGSAASLSSSEKSTFLYLSVSQQSRLCKQDALAVPLQEKVRLAVIAGIAMGGERHARNHATARIHIGGIQVGLDHHLLADGLRNASRRGQARRGRLRARTR